jgi:hypothetical protein
MAPFRNRGRRAPALAVSGFGLPVIDDPGHLLAYEFGRARRYERPISVMALPASAVREDGPARLRFSDILTLDRRRGLALILLPETGSAGLAGAVRRIRAALPAGVPIGGASFPDDALTLEDLLDTAIGGVSTHTAEVA